MPTSGQFTGQKPSKTRLDVPASGRGPFRTQQIPHGFNLTKSMSVYDGCISITVAVLPLPSVLSSACCSMRLVPFFCIILYVDALMRIGIEIRQKYAHGHSLTRVLNGSFSTLLRRVLNCVCFPGCYLWNSTRICPGGASGRNLFT